MKTIKYFTYRIMAVAAIAIAFALPAKAQITPMTYFNVDWQFSAPISNNFSNKASGWGMNFEGGYFVTPNLGLGLFLNYHSNHEYIPRETFKIGAGDVTTDQQHTMFQLPFGAAARYQWNRGGAVQPYVSAKLGAEYAKIRSNFNMLEARENSWGFYASPEVVSMYSLGFTTGSALCSVLQLWYQ